MPKGSLFVLAMFQAFPVTVRGVSFMSHYKQQNNM